MLFGAKDDSRTCAISELLVKQLRLTQNKRMIEHHIDSLILGALVAANLPSERASEEAINRLYLGNPCGNEIYGIANGSRFYFGKSVTDITLADMVSLLSISWSPGAFFPKYKAEWAEKIRASFIGKLSKSSIASAEDLSTLSNSAAFQPSFSCK